MERFKVTDENGKVNELPGATMIKSDIVDLTDATVGREDSSMKINKQYRVIYINDKYYKKWFMSKVSQKIFGKDSKYKLNIRKQEVSAVQEYRDVDLDNGTYKRADISRLLTNDKAKGVFGRLKRLYIAGHFSGLRACRKRGLRPCIKGKSSK